MVILTIFQKLPPASIWAFWHSDFTYTDHGTGILKKKTFWDVLDTFRGPNIQKSGFLGKKWSFWPFSRSHHRLQFGPFDNPISRARGLELGLVCARCFGGYWTHLGVKKSKKVQFLTIFWIFLSPLLGAFGFIYIKELHNIYLPTSTFFIWVKKRDFNTPPPVVSLWCVYLSNI